MHLKPLALLSFIACFSFLTWHILAADQTALDRYIAAPDPSYSFRLVSSHDGGKYTTHVLDMTSQTWHKYLRTGDERWPARLPMTKSAVRAMDTVQAFCANHSGGTVKIANFVVAGASKRGWTTWTTAAVDPRVVAIVPIVIDTLNLE